MSDVKPENKTKGIPAPPKGFGKGKDQNKGRPYRVSEPVEEIRRRREEEEERLRKREKRVQEKPTKQAYITETTGIQDDTLRNIYLLSTAMEVWYQQVEDVTFPTSFLTLTSEDKCAILFKFWFATDNWKHFDKAQDRLDGEKAKELERLFDTQLQSSCGVATSAVVNGNSTSAHDFLVRRTDAILKSLEDRISALIPDIGAFVKLTSSSAKDSPLVFEKATAAFIAESLEHGDETNDARWIRFETARVHASCVHDGMEAVRLLTCSQKVANDLENELRNSGTSSERINLAVRLFDPNISPARELRAFVWDGQVTAVVQGGCVWQELKHWTEQQDRIKEDVRQFFSDHILGKITPESGGVLQSREYLPRHFMVDLLYHPDANPPSGVARKFTVIEVNPFDGDYWGVYSGSTALYRYMDTAGFLEDFETLLGFADFEKRQKKPFGNMDTNCIDLRLTSPSETKEHIKSYLTGNPDLLNLIYGSGNW